MVTIRREQQQVFTSIALRAFEDELVQDLFRRNARHAEAIGDTQVRATVRLGLDQATRYDMKARGAVAYFVEMMTIFGSGFDTDVQFPWAGRILQSRRFVSDLRRADALFERTRDYVRNVYGMDGQHALTALRMLLQLAASPEVPLSASSFVDSVCDLVRAIHPQKYDYVGRAIIENSVRRGALLAREYAFTETREMALMALLALSLGHEFRNDPWFPWPGRTLRDPAFVTPRQRSKRLEERMVAYLRRVVKDAGQV